tara:strand:- start:265 stop:813 length:549 start_codon:yes stop_codon:yes gene_type:complete
MKRPFNVILLLHTVAANRLRGYNCEEFCGVTRVEQYNMKCATCITGISPLEFCQQQSAVPGCENVLDHPWAHPEDETWFSKGYKRLDGQWLYGDKHEKGIDIHNNFYDNSKQHEHMWIDTRYGNGPRNCKHPPCKAMGLAWYRAHPWALWSGGKTPLEEQRQARAEGVASSGETRSSFVAID